MNRMRLSAITAERIDEDQSWSQGHFTKHMYLGFFVSNSNTNSSDLTTGYFYPTTNPTVAATNEDHFVSYTIWPSCHNCLHLAITFEVLTANILLPGCKTYDNRLEGFAATEFNDIFSGSQPLRDAKETLQILTRLTARENLNR
jgi:hypothetical protein